MTINCHEIGANCLRLFVIVEMISSANGKDTAVGQVCTGMNEN